MNELEFITRLHRETKVRFREEKIPLINLAFRLFSDESEMASYHPRTFIQFRADGIKFELWISPLRHQNCRCRVHRFFEIVLTTVGSQWTPRQVRLGRRRELKFKHLRAGRFRRFQRVWRVIRSWIWHLMLGVGYTTFLIPTFSCTFLCWWRSRQTHANTWVLTTTRIVQIDFWNFIPRLLLNLWLTGTQRLRRRVPRHFVELGDFALMCAIFVLPKLEKYHQFCWLLWIQQGEWYSRNEINDTRADTSMRSKKVRRSDDEIKKWKKEQKSEFFMILMKTFSKFHNKRSQKFQRIYFLDDELVRSTCVGGW